MIVAALTDADWALLKEGALRTSSVFAVSLALSLVLGTIVGIVLSRSTSRLWTMPLRWLVSALSFSVRGIPSLILLLYVFYLPSAFGVTLSPFTAAAIVLTAIGGAMIGEGVRAALDSVPQGQWLAARSLGLTFPQAMARVIAPQALLVAVPPSVGIAAQLLKQTSVTSIVGYTELIRAGKIIATRGASPVTAFMAVAAAYVVLALPLMLLGRHLERRLKR